MAWGVQRRCCTSEALDIGLGDRADKASPCGSSRAVAARVSALSANSGGRMHLFRLDLLEVVHTGLSPAIDTRALRAAALCSVGADRMP
ncbi:hypothetical protein O7635_09895 [Asanoa sp. WMMD1127]|uniref:hypothetical protein n=1 Tax=Asanoa sp. WMMD1127 TaxID=3016107 RepID=UPI002416CAE3|nr:hypothetical protein [Asanoa sp. WMMD1127]MDG4822165.1 hypothetical protein [Asanoa sp. WMMD1127]